MGPQPASVRAIAAPSMTAPDRDGFKLPVPYVHLADGSHAGCRWWLERLPPPISHPWLTVHGVGAAGQWSWSGELPNASPAEVRRKVEEVAAVQNTRSDVTATRKAARYAKPADDTQYPYPL